MSPLFYLFLGLFGASVFTFAVSAYLNRKAISMIFQLQRDIKTSTVTLEQALTNKSDIDAVIVEEDVAEIEARFGHIEKIHAASRLFMFSTVGLTVLHVVVLIAYAIIGN